VLTTLSHTSHNISSQCINRRETTTYVQLATEQSIRRKSRQESLHRKNKSLKAGLKFYYAFGQ